MHRTHYIIRSPYTGRLINPQEVTVLESAHGSNYLREYPEVPNEDVSLDYYGVQVPDSDLYQTELEAYKAYVQELKYKIKTLYYITHEK